MSNQDYSNLKSSFNNKAVYTAFVNVLEKRQDAIVKYLLIAKDIGEVRKSQGAWYELERLKSLQEEINGAEKNGRTTE